MMYPENARHKQAVVTVGVPGCGKSTYAATLTKDGRFDEVNLDACRLAVSGDAANQDCTPRALKLHSAQIDQAIASNRSLVVSDTNLNAKFRRELVSKLQAAGYEVIIVAFLIPFEICMERNAKRDRTVPADAMTRMQAVMEANTPRMGDADLVWYVYPQHQAAA